MITIAICDDEIKVCHDLKKIVREIGSKIDIDINISIFTTGTSLIERINEFGSYDIIFVDIEMEGLNGIDLGLMIRDEMLDEETKLIYISSIKDYAMDLFNVRVTHFLVKPLTGEKVTSVLVKTIGLVMKNSFPFEYKIGKRVFVSSISDIIYFESIGKKIKIVTKKETREFYGSLSSIAKRNLTNFIQIHRSYLVNFTFIESYTYTKIYLNSGKLISIGSDRREKVSEYLISATSNYMKGE